MALHRLCLLAVVLSVLLLDVSEAQESPQQCMSKFTQGKDGFVLDTDESVKEGATFLSSPQVSTVSECVSACCSDPNCNLALIESTSEESTSEESTIHACFTFNCLYKQKQVCRFVRKTGFKNYLLNSGEDKPPKAKAGQDRVIQPNEVVTLNGIESKDDHKIVDFKWTLVSGNPSAVIEIKTFWSRGGQYIFAMTILMEI
uniref:MANSC domain-containing protein n=1 Tax=Astyanax mexicanus TaxID=7994 RepID=A0A8B9GPP6_ASTMX